MYEKLDEVKYNQPPYSTKYPKLAILLDSDPAIPQGNVIIRNISYGGRWIDLFDGLDFSLVTVKDNLIADPVLSMWCKKIGDKMLTYKYGDKGIMDILSGSGNILMDKDPGFVDIANQNFQLKEDSPAWKLGFKPIPFEKIGLYIDGYRTSLPKKK
jgi:hypothetical protein